jgi:hypothetical protein
LTVPPPLADRSASRKSRSRHPVILNILRVCCPNLQCGRPMPHRRHCPLKLSWADGFDTTSVALAATALLCCAVQAAASAATPPSLCAANEEVVFACAQGQDIISLCAVPAAYGSAQTQLRYVYGKQRKIKLEVSQAAHPEAFTSGVAGLAGGGIDFVRVRNGDFAYVVYTGLSPGWSQDGWIVEAHGSPISHHICKRVATGEKVWGPVYAAKLPRANDSASFRPPDWIGAARSRSAR